MLDQAPQVQTRSGVVRGVWRDGSAAFFGIPFAEPPTADRRFGPPVPAAPWHGVLDATQWGPTPQRRPLKPGGTLVPEPSIAGDSTLNVSVFTPRPGEPDAALPVLVWIHGGGFVAGSAANPWTSGAAFARDGVVTVNLSYRLGFDGFGWIADAPMNRGVLDWLLALEWVRDTIAEFGGDPARVTIAGQSAGAGAVLTLLAMPRAARLFHRAISLSGAVADVPLARAEAVGRALAAGAGVEPTRAGLSRLTEDQILDLQQATAPLDAAAAGSDPLGGLAALMGTGLPWGPVVDRDLIPESALRAIARGAGAATPLLLGTTDGELALALAPQEQLLTDVAPADALARLGVPADGARAYVSDHPGRSTARLVGELLTDRMFRSPARAVAEHRALRGAPTWLYRFSWPSPRLGCAVHCLDIPFFFDRLDAEQVEGMAGAHPPVSLATEVHSAAVRFARDGDPGWPRYEPPARVVHVYDVPSRDLADGYADVALPWTQGATAPDGA